MNSFHCRRWLEALAAVDTTNAWEGPLALAAALPDAEWEGAIRGDEPGTVRLAARGKPTPESRKAAAKALGLAPDALGSDAGSSESPWLDARWDARSRQWRAVELGLSGGVRRLLPVSGPVRKLKSKPFKAKDFGEPSAAALAEFHALVPVRRVISTEGRDGWILELERFIPWPLFLRCDVSAAFTARASQLSLLLRDARVRAIEFDGEALWARFVG